MKPANVLVICSDEHARSAAGCYGHSIVQTPTLDTLSLRGTVFERAYTPSPICVSARASLATGLAVHENRCWSSAEPYCGILESWMHRLRNRGHAVLSFGKLHFRSNKDDNGFSEEIIPMHVTNDGLGWPQGLLRNPLPPFDETSELAELTGPGESTYTEYDRRITAKTCQWLRQSAPRIKNQPWVIFVSFVSPHYPLTAPQEFYDLYAGYEIPQPFGIATEERIQHPVLDEIRRFWNYDDYFNDASRTEARRCYYGLVSFLDDNIGKVLAAVEDSGCANETAIVYISDHGEMLGNLGMWAKSVMYEDSAGIPMIAAGPGFTRGRCKIPVSLIDIGVTVEQSVGIDPTKNFRTWQAQSLQNVISNNDRDRFVLSEYHDGGTPVSFYMIRYGDWKYIHYAGGHPPQLFNLTRDPMELKNLSSSPEFERDRNRMQELLLQILDPDDVAKQCSRDQAARIEEYGGRDAIMAMESFNHTPVN